jgi:hypothetical protein
LTSAHIPWRDHARREIASVGRRQRVLLGVLWASSGALALSFLFLVEPSLNPLSGAVVAALMLSAVPVLLAISLVLKVGYAMAADRMPRVTGAFETLVTYAFLLLFAVAFVLAAWEERAKVVSGASNAIGVVLALIGAALVGIGNFAESVLSLRGLLVIIAILLYLILQRLHQMKR